MTMKILFYILFIATGLPIAGVLIVHYSNQQPTLPPSLATATPSPSAPQMIGQVVWVKGLVKAITTTKKERILQRRSDIFAEDTLVTDAKSTGQIICTDNSTISLSTNTTFKVAEYKYHPSNPGGSNKFVGNLVKGCFRTITGFISKGASQNYSVGTPVATIGVRGTGYSACYADVGSSAAAAVGPGLHFKLEIGAVTLTNPTGTVNLNAETGNLYASVPSPTAPPVETATPSPVFKQAIVLIKAIAPPAPPSAAISRTRARDNILHQNPVPGSGGVGGAGGAAAIISPVNIIPTGDAPKKPPSDSFCIN